MHESEWQRIVILIDKWHGFWSLWYRARVGAMGGRIRKIMIVALARKLLVALWRYVKDGVIPNGAKMKAA